jgi:serine/threonine protein kinase
MSKNPKAFLTAFDQYATIATIGEGGAGRVFEVRDTSGETFALKCLHPDLATTEKRKRFKNEISFCSKNTHPNLIRVLDWGVVDWGDTQTLFYVMPKYAGTLRGSMNAKIPPDQVLRIFGQILDGVEAAHMRGVIHRDLKPENILCTQDKQVYLVADLGIAHFHEDMLATMVETKQGHKVLNIAHSAPEQRTRGGSVDHRADVYALGQILNEMFTGSVPEGTGYDTIGSVSPEFGYLDGLVEQMRQQKPDARPQSIGAIKNELIGQRNDFIGFQELDEKRNEVVRTNIPNAVEPVEIIAGNWDKGVLTLTLNRVPEHDWTIKFRQPGGDFGYMQGIGPTAYAFKGRIVEVAVEARYAQNATDQFKSWSPKATEALQEELVRAAHDKDIEQRRKLAVEIAQAEEKGLVNSKLRI